MEFLIELIGEVIFGVIGDIINESSDSIRKRKGKIKDYFIVGIPMVGLLSLIMICLYGTSLSFKDGSIKVSIILSIFTIVFVYILFRLIKRIYKDEK